MSKSKTPVLSLIRQWFKRTFLCDAFFATRENILNPIVEYFWEPEKRKQFPTYLPQIEGLERREVLTTVGFPFTPPPVVLANAGTAVVPVTLDSSSASTITVAYSTSDDTAYAGTDYTPTSGTLTFPPSATSEN